MISAYYDPLDKKCKSIIGAIEKNKTLRLAIFTSCENCSLIFTDDSGKDYFFYGTFKNGIHTFSVKLTVSGIYFYRFILDGKNFGLGKFGKGEFTDEKFQLLVCDSYDYPVEREGETIYQIFPDRFCRAEGFGKENGKRIKSWGEEPDYLPDKDGKIKNDDFFGGNFKGIESKLPYLKSLGVSTIYLNPVVKAYSSHRYDTGDYLSFDELLGTDEDFKSLVNSALKEGIKIIFDGVFNHTGDDSIYFNKYLNYDAIGAYNSKSSPYYDWFTFKEYPDEYTSWWGITTLPTVRRNCEKFERLVVGEGGVIDRYLSLGVSGVRLDVVDELSDDFIKKINDKVKSYGKDKIVIGEVWEDATNKIAYDERKKYFTSGELDGVMNYPLRKAIFDYLLSGDAIIIYSLVREQIDHYPNDALNLLMNIIGTHDTPRAITYLGKSGYLAQNREDMAFEVLTENEYLLGKKRLKCASLLQYTLYGNPSVYYGDEIGMQGNKDPFNRRCFEEEKEDEELSAWYKFLGELRRKYDCFKGGETVDVKYYDGVFSFARAGENSAVTVVLNCGDCPCEIKTKKSEAELMRGKVSSVTLGKYEYAIFVKENSVYLNTVEKLKSLSDEKFKAFSEKAIKGNKPLLGVRSKDIKAVAKNLKGKDAERYVKECEFAYYEDTLIYGFLIARKGVNDFISAYKTYLKHADSWALIDSFVPSINFLKKLSDKAEFYREIEENFDKSDGFMSRFYIVTLMDFYLTEERLDEIFSMCVKADGKGYYVDMAVAWLISNAYIKFEDKTYEFLKEKRLSKFTHNKAIQKITESYRVKDKEKIKNLRIK